MGSSALIIVENYRFCPFFSFLIRYFRLSRVYALSDEQNGQLNAISPTSLIGLSKWIHSPMGSTISIPRDRQNKIATGIVSGAIFNSSHFFAIKSFDSFSISPTSRFISIQILGVAGQSGHTGQIGRTCQSGRRDQFGRTGQSEHTDPLF